MEFLPVALFQHPNIPIKLKIRRQSTVTPTQQVKITKSLYIPQEEAIYLGLSNGEIHSWKKRMPDKVTPNQDFTQKDCDLSNFSDENSHKGDITSLLYEESLYEGLIISGSADSKIKI